MSDENPNKFLDLRMWNFEWLVLVFGFLLILLGVTNGFEVPWLKQLVPDPNFRWVSVLIGVALCVGAILIRDRASTGGSIPAHRSNRTAKLDASAYKEMLQDEYTSQRQREILTIVYDEPSRNFRAFDTICAAIRQKVKSLEHISNDEIYYRLEQLYLLGFLEKKQPIDAGGKTWGRNWYRASSGGHIFSGSKVCRKIVY